MAAGGTGGHMFPAQALAEAMLARGWRVELSTDARGARYASGFPDRVRRRETRAQTFAQGSLFERASTPFAIAAGAFATWRAMRRDRPACVAGFGGYPAVPAMLAAGWLRVPVLIHEANGVLGRVNRRFAPKVDVVACGIWPTEVPAGAKAVHVGNPVRSAVLEQHGAAYIEPGRHLVGLLIIGGSQGAGLFGRVVPEAVRLLPADLRARLRISQQVRPEDMDKVRATYEEIGVAAELKAFFDDVPERLAAATLAVSRAGASSIADISVVGRPAILIPYAAAMDDHQAANAAGLVAAGGAFMIREAELTAEGLAGTIECILSDPAGAAAMAEASRAAGRPDATEHLAALVESLAANEGQ
ncbi:MAG: UDP-N-acetylglucosamine--N-acetylmuramyl-(pentapeptide) pyrophosphoryl-undecaprenol N-acetylglucosamine transferase [Amaricoccus sp.]